MKGLFVTFEGGEGAGKSTLIRALDKHLRSSGIETFCTREPGGSSFGPLVREILLEGESLGKEAELFLFLADRAEHVKGRIKPALLEGKTVLCDRFADSTLVYQGVARALDITFVKEACQVALQGLSPDITFLLDLDPEIGLQRAANRHLDRIEKETLHFHRTVRKAYLELAKENRERIIVLDASKSPEELKNQAIEKFYAFSRQ
jgi:dTMP kinase